MNNVHRNAIIASAFVAMAAAIALGYWWGHSSEPQMASEQAGATPVERKVLYWYDPMVPDQHFDKPGKSPFMDMQLLPKYADEATTAGIAIEPGIRQSLGIRTVVVKRGLLAAGMRVPGTIDWDLRQERIVSARVDAIIDRLHVRAPYTPVSAGQPIASIIAPTWGTAVAEARALANAQSETARQLRSAANQRLRALGLPAGSSTGQGGRITLTSPVTGVVSEVGVREGESASSGTLLFRINGTRTVWLEAAIPQADIAGIAPGTPVEAAVDAMPGKVFHGQVELLPPRVDASSRTQRARIVLDNPDGLLAPGMFAQVTLQPTGSIERPLVPTDALIGTGADARVIVLEEDDTFHPVRVQTGRSGDGMTEILAGLQGGERVVSSGQFLIDSEANLSGALARLNAIRNDAPASMPSDVMPGMSEIPAATAPTSSHPAAHAAPHVASPATAAKKMAPTQVAKPVAEPTPDDRSCAVAYWYDPMVPDKHFDKPGKSPFMDMQLVPKFAPGASPECTNRDVQATELQP